VLKYVEKLKDQLKSEKNKERFIWTPVYICDNSF
jgi:hypothetical protein